MDQEQSEADLSDNETAFFDDEKVFQSIINANKTSPDKNRLKLCADKECENKFIAFD